MRNTATKTLLVIGLSATLFAAGCNSTDQPAGPSDPADIPTSTEISPPDDDGTSPDTTEGSTQSTEDPNDPGPAAGVNALAAIEAALAHKPDTVVVEIDLEDDDGVWEVAVWDTEGRGFDIYVDATTGEVVGENPTPVNSWQHTAPTVTAAEAVEIALAEKPGVVDSLDFDRHQGAEVWEVVVHADDGTEWEIYLDPESGEVIKVEQDD